MRPFDGQVHFLHAQGRGEGQDLLCLHLPLGHATDLVVKTTDRAAEMFVPLHLHPLRVQPVEAAARVSAEETDGNVFRQFVQIPRRLCGEQLGGVGVGVERRERPCLQRVHKRLAGFHRALLHPIALQRNRSRHRHARELRPLDRQVP